MICGSSPRGAHSHGAPASKVRRESPAKDCLLIAVWFGVVTGLLEVLLWVARKLSPTPFSFLSKDIVWMAPLAGMATFVVPALVLCFASVLFRRRLSPVSGTLLFAFLATSSLLFWFHQFHWIPAILLALGSSYQLWVFTRARFQGFRRLVQRTVWKLIILVMGLIGITYSWQTVVEKNALAQVPLSSPDTPNLLFIVLDTVRAQSLSLHGNPKRTSPNLESLASTGVHFQSAISTSPWTLPSHASMFTGRFPHELSVGWYNPLDSTYPTLSEILARQGYVTSGFVANTVFCSYESGLDRGFAHFEDYSVSPGELFRSLGLIRRPMLEFFSLRQLLGYYDLLGRKTAARVNQDFLTWLDRQPNRPFFAFLNYFDAHDPYLPQPPFAITGPASTAEYRLLWNWWTMDKRDLPPEKIDDALTAYEGCITYLDHQLGLLVESLRERGILKNTLLIITSDHGELFGEHDLFCHGHCLYRPVVQVPLMISYPTRVPPGLTVSQPVSLRDIPATVIDLLGLENGDVFPGSSLSRFWQKGKSFPKAQDIVLSEIDAPPPPCTSGPRSVSRCCRTDEIAHPRRKTIHPKLRKRGGRALRLHGGPCGND